MGMGYRQIIALILAFLAALLSDPTLATPDTIRVGIKETSEFVVNRDGKVSGDAIEKWESMYGGDSIYTIYSTVDDLIGAVKNGEVDVAVGAITVTVDRERDVDFLFPYMQTGLSYGSLTKDTVLDLFYAMMPTFLKGLAAIFIVNLMAGALFATVEHRANDDVDSTWTSMFTGFYWSSATLTTVGYGDVAAKTTLGKLISTVWMWSGLIITGMMTGLIMSAITVESSNDVDFNVFEDRVAVVSGSAGFHYAKKLAKENNIHIYDTIDEAMKSVNDGDTAGVIHDKVLLDNVAKNYPDVVVSETLLTKDYYAFAVPEKWPYTEELNRRLLVSLEN